MSLEIIRGTIRNPKAMESLIDGLNKLNDDGTLYAGYPVIATADSSHTVEALLISSNFGLVAFNFSNGTENFNSVKDSQDHIYYLIEGNLNKHESLRNGRKLAIIPNVISFYPTEGNCPENENESQYKFADQTSLLDVLSTCNPISEEYFRPLCAAIQRVTSIKPIKKRVNVKHIDSKGAILKKIEKEIANLDQWQKKAAIEVPDGPQRIRGLAGSGKTVVIALKAAYLHSQHPDWNIIVTYHTRSLNQQFKDLIERFTLEHSGDKPNWEKLRILHSWGSVNEPGVYSDIANTLNILPMDYTTAKSKYGMSGAFEGICTHTLTYMNQGDFKPIYDAVLIDEAQDLPIPFFKMIFLATKPPKLIVWAYDELQNLSNTIMAPVDQLFGTDENGTPLVSVTNDENKARRDIILPVCYRNTPWALTLAHALGFGIYRKELVQLFDELSLWKDVGYDVKSGSLTFGSHVTLERGTDSSPTYFKDLLRFC